MNNSKGALMPENADCFPMLNTLLFVTTILFMIFSAVLIRRILRLRLKIDKMRKRILEQNQLLKSKKDISSKLLKPYESETAKSIILSVNANHEITYVNDYAEELFGFTKEELLNHNIFDTIYAENDKDESLQENIVDRILSNPKMYMEHETENLKKNGDKVWISWTNRVIYSEDGKPAEVRSVGFDISKRKQLEMELRSLSATDSVTGVYNRQTFLDVGVTELKRAVRYKRQLSLLVLKLDFFRSVDEDKTFTDEILKDTISVCLKSIRESDIIGRLSDIEFGILMPETPIENALFFAEQLRQKIQERNLKNKNDIFIDVDFGVAERKRADDTIDNIMTRAFNAIKNGNDTIKRKTKPSK